MKEFEVWFELFGKKLKTTVIADDEVIAKQRIIDKIIFHKVAEKKTVLSDEAKDFLCGDDSFNNLLDIFGFNK